MFFIFFKKIPHLFNSTLCLPTDVIRMYKKRGWEPTNGSELDTARSEDYDPPQANKHVAGVTVDSFDEILVDSDVDTVKSSQVREKFRTAMAHSSE